MALSGSVSTNHFSDSAVNETYMTFSWSATQDKAANTSKVTWEIVVHRPGTSNYVYFHNFNRTVYAVWNSKGSGRYAEGDVIDSGSFTVTHDNATGVGSFSMNMAANVYYSSGGYIYAEKTFTLDTIPRKFTSTPVISANSKTVNSYTFNWETSETCSEVILYINGTKKATKSDLSAKSGTITATGLTPATTYTAYVKCKRKDSGITTDSKTKEYTTYQVATISEATNFNDEQNPTITYSNPQGSSIDTLRACIASNDGKTVYVAYRDISKTATSYTFTLTDSERTTLRKACPNATSLAVKFYIRTIENDVTYNKTIAKTMTIKNGNPVFTDFDIAEADDTIYNLTQNRNKFIRKYSDIKITIASADKMVAQKNSTAKSYNVIVGDESKTLTYSTSDLSTTIANMDANKVEIYAVDSRGKQTGVSKSLSIINYKEVALNSIAFTRKNNVEETVLVTGKGTWTNVNFGSVTNKIKTFAFRRKKKKETSWSGWQSLTDLFNINTNGTIANKAANEITAMTFEFGEEYDVQVKIQDELSSVTKDITVNSGKILMSALKEHGVCFGGIYDETEGGVLQLVKNNYGPGPTGGFNLRNSDIVNANGIWWADESTGHEGLNFLKQDGDKLNADDYECLRGYRGRVWYGGGTSLAFFDEAHPVGSFLATNKNVNPGNSMPGTWVLVDKELKQYFGALTEGTHYTLDSTNCSGADVVLQRQGHTVWLRISFTTKVDLSDTTANILTLSPNSIGLDTFTHTWGVILGYADGANCLGAMAMSYDTGLLTTRDFQNVDGSKILPAGSTMAIIMSQETHYTDMLDGTCSKFIWQRTE